MSDRSRTLSIVFSALLTLSLVLSSCSKPSVPSAPPTPPASPTGVVVKATEPTSGRTITSAATPSATTAPVASASPAVGTTPGPRPAASPFVSNVTPQDTVAQATAAERPLRDLADLAVRFKQIPPMAATPNAAANPGGYSLGRRDTFWVSDQRAKTYYTTTATIALLSPHAYFYVEDGRQVSPDALRQAADAFETTSYPTVRRYFGSEQPGPDGDQRITVLNARVPSVGGYFSSDDQYPRSVSPHSNERNIVYINIDAYSVGSRQYDATLAHEFQHLVSWSVDRSADTWFNEGSSELAMQLSGFSAGGAETSYANDPNTQLTAWSEDDNKTLAHYGAGYIFLSYFLEHYGGYEALPELLAQNNRGSAMFDSYLSKKGYNVRFDDVFRDWVIANYLDDRRTADGRYWYKDISIRAKSTPLDRFPTDRSGTIAQYAARYFDLDGGQGDLTIEFDGATKNKLLGNDPASGRFEWWSNRGDLMDTTLTRDFDLSGLGKATLQFSTWYDIEEGFDFAYAEASADGGRSWQALKGQYTTTEDSIGHNLGNGYTGKSGGTTSVQWVRESIDLTPFAGKAIKVRFEHVTDDAFNAPGFAVDDIAIPELGFSDDAEAGDNGWQAVGFVRTANIIPQSYSLQLIAIGEPNKVEVIPVDGQGHASYVTHGLGKDYRRMVLVIAPTAEVTTEPASFQLALTPAT